MSSDGQLRASAPSAGLPPGLLGPDAALPDGMRLHIGGKVRKPGWTVLDITPGAHVDIVGDCADLGRIPDAACAVVYASHVLEHLGYDRTLPHALREIHRVLAPDGRILVSVPDLDILCRLFTVSDITGDERFFVMRMMFGGRMDAHDVHLVGLNAEFLGAFLSNAGFVDLKRVREFGLFEDSSAMLYKGCPVSLNVIGRKPARGP